MTLKECIKLNKADLHVHLNGLFDTNAIKKVIEDENLEIPKGFDLDKDLNVLTYKKTLLSPLRKPRFLKSSRIGYLLSMTG